MSVSVKLYLPLPSFYEGICLLFMRIDYDGASMETSVFSPQFYEVGPPSHLTLEKLIGHQPPCMIGSFLGFHSLSILTHIFSLHWSCFSGQSIMNITLIEVIVRANTINGRLICSGFAPLFGGPQCMDRRHQLGREGDPI